MRRFVVIAAIAFAAQARFALAAPGLVPSVESSPSAQSERPATAAECAAPGIASRLEAEARSVQAFPSPTLSPTMLQTLRLGGAGDR